MQVKSGTFPYKPTEQSPRQKQEMKDKKNPTVLPNGCISSDWL